MDVHGEPLSEECAVVEGGELVCVVEIVEGCELRFCMAHAGFLVRGEWASHGGG